MKFHTDMEEIPNLMPDLAISVYRIVQEALANAIKYSMATDIYISVKTIDNCLEIGIRDNGKGLIDENVLKLPTFGITGMQARAEAWGGKFELIGNLGKGTEIRAIIPLPII